jgi:hypothetical protein
MSYTFSINMASAGLCLFLLLPLLSKCLSQRTLLLVSATLLVRSVPSVFVGPSLASPGARNVMLTAVIVVVVAVAFCRLRRCRRRHRSCRPS